MYLRVTIDVPISYEEAQFIKETYIYNTVVEKLLDSQKQVKKYQLT